MANKLSLSDFVPLASECETGASAKPSRGSGVLAREKDDAAALKVELEQKGIAKKRDGRCRWPEKHKCRGGLEAAHIRDASLGGAMHADNLIVLCAWIHRRGPESIHGKQLSIDCETEAGARGGLSFWRKGNDGAWYLVRREIRPFEYERD